MEAIFGSLSPLWDAVTAAAEAKEAAESVRMWIRLGGCVITSHDMFPPVPV